MSTVLPAPALFNHGSWTARPGDKVLIAAIATGYAAATNDLLMPYAISLLAVGVFVVLCSLPQVAMLSLETLR